MTANAKQMMVVNLVNSMLDEEGAEIFADELFRMLERRVDERLITQPLESMREKLEPFLETERAVAGVAMLIDIARRVQRIATRYHEARDLEVASAFDHLATKLLAMAEKHAAPVMSKATAFRAAARKDTN